MMEPRAALRVLVTSASFQAADKARLLAEVDTMTDEQVQEFGVILAKQQQQETEAAAQAVTALDALLATETPE